jgi:hypothetical protein
VQIALVFAQVRGAHKGLSTVLARVWFLTSVGADVLPVVRGPGVGLIAEGTPVGPLSGVQAPVLLERAAMGVGFPAQLARVGLRGAALRRAGQLAGLEEGTSAPLAPTGTRFHLQALSRALPVLVFGAAVHFCQHCYCQAG